MPRQGCDSHSQQRLQPRAWLSWCRCLSALYCTRLAVCNGVNKPPAAVLSHCTSPVFKLFVCWITEFQQEEALGRTGTRGTPTHPHITSQSTRPQNMRSVTLSPSPASSTVTASQKGGTSSLPKADMTGCCRSDSDSDNSSSTLCERPCCRQQAAGRRLAIKQATGKSLQ